MLEMSSEVLEATSHSRRPKDSPFFQQRLPAWQPMFTAKKSAITFIVMGLVFIPIGVVLLVTSNNVTEYVVDYTDCLDPATNKSCASQLDNGTCDCVSTLAVASDIPGPVYFYYGLKNFYQNHRRYGRSKSDAQLLGNKVDVNSLSSCDPYATVTMDTVQKAILPCGAIANSIFNDTFLVTYQYGTASETPVNMTKKGIAWKSDVDKKYGTLTSETVADTVKPPNWHQTELERSPGAFKTDEELMVWMRVAALPNFRKLHRRVVHSGVFANGLPAGNYTVHIKYSFPVTGFGGRKSFVIGNVSWLGGKNNTLGVTCIVTGALHVLLGVGFLIVYIYAAKRKFIPLATQHVDIFEIPS